MPKELPIILPVPPVRRFCTVRTYWGEQNPKPYFTRALHAQPQPDVQHHTPNRDGPELRGARSTDGIRHQPRFRSNHSLSDPRAMHSSHSLHIMAIKKGRKKELKLPLRHEATTPPRAGICSHRQRDALTRTTAAPDETGTPALGCLLVGTQSAMPMPVSAPSAPSSWGRLT
eukprot:4529481-Prymnesium_polylepis.1